MTEDDFEALHLELADRLEDIQLLVMAGSISEVRRQLHSLKGLAKAFGFAELAAAVHDAEECPEAGVLQPKIDRMFTMLDAA